jgi:hypothetical protein
VKHVDAVSPKQLETAIDGGQLTIVARLREAHALEGQQRVLSGSRRGRYCRSSAFSVPSSS